MKFIKTFEAYSFPDSLEPVVKTIYDNIMNILSRNESVKDEMCCIEIQKSTDFPYGEILVLRFQVSLRKVHT